ncbi:GRP family sugar transporter [Paracidobacterium acidisoli]|uniref:EamA/RhaT family transporter n=1 Tax=Paracidobacterium acidisoli TaxID=2303751 RepID=A0A372ITQ5_9BACT|nr:GRP family sugar transporter [Paracidobacterium acidisoli]MBT9329717.1 EamA family transporter [Paracidobacterium acidisoli]
MSTRAEILASRQMGALHGLGVICGLGAGVWLGAAEAPTKLVNSGLSPFAVSLCMVAGVFTARWTFPTMLKGTEYVFADLMRKKHLIVWAILAGALWAVANTLTVFAVRDVGLAVAFPLWNANSLIGLFWGRVLFGELKGAGTGTVLKVVAGTVAIIAAAILLGFSTIHGGSTMHPHAIHGVIAAAGASLLWGTMYVPYRKAYVSGMNPLSFVTAFTVGELGTMFALVLTLDGGTHAAVFHSSHVKPMLFWLFLGGFVWVIGDLLQQFATKYLGIGRGIPLSNTNQLWGLAWGALVFGELVHAPATQKLMVIAGSAIMILGALLISLAAAGQQEHSSTSDALLRECDRYGMNYSQVLAEYCGSEFGNRSEKRRWWDYAILTAAVGLFVWLGKDAVVPALAMNFHWLIALVATMILCLAACGWALWKTTRFS